MIVPSPHHCHLRPPEQFLTFTGGLGNWLPVFLSIASPTFTLYDLNVHEDDISSHWLLSFFSPLSKDHLGVPTLIPRIYSHLEQFNSDILSSNSLFSGH